MRPRLRHVALALLVVLGLAASAPAGDRDRLIVREARVRPDARGSCRLGLYVSAEPGFWPVVDQVEVSIGGIGLLGGSATRSTRNEDKWHAQRWTFRDRNHAAVHLDLDRGIVSVRAHGIDLSSLATSGSSDVPIVVKLGSGSASATVTFRELKSEWTFTSVRDAVVPDGSSPPYRILGQGLANVAGTGVVLAKSPRELRAMLPDAQFLPAVDFAQEIVVGVGLAYGVESCEIPTFAITGVGRTGDDVVVDLSVQYPTPWACSDAYAFYDVGACVAVPRVSGDVSMRISSTR